MIFDFFFSPDELCEATPQDFSVGNKDLPTATGLYSGLFCRLRTGGTSRRLADRTGDMVIIALLLILAVGPRVTLGADGEVRRRGRPVDRCPAGPAPPVNGHQWKPVRLLWR